MADGWVPRYTIYYPSKAKPEIVLRASKETFERILYKDDAACVSFEFDRTFRKVLGGRVHKNIPVPPGLSKKQGNEQIRAALAKIMDSRSYPATPPATPKASDGRVLKSILKRPKQNPGENSEADIHKSTPDYNFPKVKVPRSILKRPNQNLNDGSEPDLRSLIPPFISPDSPSKHSVSWHKDTGSYLPVPKPLRVNTLAVIISKPPDNLDVLHEVDALDTKRSNSDPWTSFPLFDFSLAALLTKTPLKVCLNCHRETQNLDCFEHLCCSVFSCSHCRHSLPRDVKPFRRLREDTDEDMWHYYCHKCEIELDDAKLVRGGIEESLAARTIMAENRKNGFESGYIINKPRVETQGYLVSKWP